MEAIFDISEDKINFESFVKFSKMIFGFVLLNFDDVLQNPNRKENILPLLKITGFFICASSCTLGAASFITYFLVNLDNIFDSSISISNAAYVFIVQLKMLTIFLRKNKFIELFEDLSNIFMIRQQANKNCKTKTYLDSYHRTVKIYVRFYLLVSAPGFVEIFPFVLYGSTATTLNYWFPFDPNRVEYFVLTWIWKNLMAFIVITGTLGFDSLLWRLITVIVMEFDFLKKDIERLGAPPALKSQNERKMNLETLIERHI